MVNRPNIHEYYLILAQAAAIRGTCARRKVGAIITDMDNFVLSSAYNGTPMGMEHCTDCNCPGAKYPSGEGLDKCQALHAEDVAIMKCRALNDARNIYVTCSPCIKCTQRLLNTPIWNIYFVDTYPHSESEKLWTRFNRNWKQIDISKFKDQI